MTDYNIEFIDHKVENPNRFRLVQVSPGIVDLIPIWIEDPTQIIEEGTPVNAELFEKLRANVTRRSETFAATAGQTIFNLTKAYIVGQGRLDVYISGVKQRSGIDFSETSPTSFTLSEGLEAGEIVEAVYFSASQALSEDLIEQVQAAEAATLAANDAADDANDAATGALTANLNWKEPVNNLTALNALASPQTRDTRQTKDTGNVYRYDGTAWVLIQTMDPNAINALDTRLTSQLADIAISVKSFGAVGDGVADDTAAFVSAFASVAEKGTIFIPKGIYKITSMLSTDKRIAIEGAGKDLSVLQFTHTDGTDCLRFAKETDPGITRIKFTGFSIIGNAATRDGLYLGYVTDSSFNDLLISGCGRDGIHLEKGWIIDSKKTTVRENGRHGFYAASIAAAYSEVNAITIQGMNSIRNKRIGVVIGDEALTYSENTGFGFAVKESHFSENGVGNIQLSGARAVNINDGNYFEVVGTRISEYGGDPFHVYVGKRSGSGVGVCQEVNIEGNHFNAMNDSRYGANNATGYAVVLDHVIGVNIGKNHFYQSVQGSILAKSNARRVDIKPNSVYESVGIPFLTDQTNEEVVYWEQTKNTVSLKGDFAGKTFANQGFENIIRNGEFLAASASNVPNGFTTQSFTYTKEPDGTLVATANGGGFAKLLYTLPANRLNEFKGKYVTLTIRCKVPTDNQQNYFVFTGDGVTEVTQSIAKNDTYADISVTRKLSDSATKLELGILNYGATTVVSDKVYVKWMAATKGRSATPFQRHAADHHNENLIHYAELSLPNLKVAADNAAAQTAGVPSFGIYRDTSGNIKIRTT